MDNRKSRVDPNLLVLARGMRHDPAPAELKMWYCLRNRRLNGFKFRRQHPIDCFIADFFCAECHLVVEADGESHVGQAEVDEKRSARLKSLGNSVIRFSNVDVHENLEGVLLAILGECERLRAERVVPSPQPSPLRTGERE